MVSNNILISSMLCFLAIWKGLGVGIKKVIAKVRNFMWSGSKLTAKSRVAWRTCCREKLDGGLILVDPIDAVLALISK